MSPLLAKTFDRLSLAFCFHNKKLSNDQAYYIFSQVNETMNLWTHSEQVALFHVLQLSMCS